MKYFIEVIDFKSIIVISIACFFTYTCLELGFIFDIPTDLIGIAIVFPIVFSINAAYVRREKALTHFSEIKGSALAIRLAHMHWVNADTSSHLKKLDNLYSQFFKKLSSYLKSDSPTKELYNDIILQFRDISLQHEELRSAGLSTSETSRSNQYLRIMIVHFENIINIKSYRTPNSLRAYSKVFLNAFPIIFSPFFAFVASNNSPLFGFALAIMYGLVLTSLDNIQDDLEDPFDGIGSDDISLEFPDMLSPDLITD
ncbi:MAG: hypothetical protein HOB40_02990 [Candidatus Marinimicrobia bacterium]|jgi:predicted membrane chloride channel (bestrophin family)|nr:hypothetical protein [Candidatus Neomarinimicrobiota bacterium]MBT3501140.1 hypothetical protein [Candidatus Neomarinimicrobiota bacterium]MBT3840440.1 hypothetical protein [Candidatus Neomarinimicrobiota bacterium]MBT4000006.1 hypothetical protein [Candidatus Neomarinimicrobiota bacterium]MBT4579197.1 hypothetical protein [Candidatus Neomarinimicrobiota bacterium]